MHKIFTTPVAEVYLHYVNKIERKSGNKDDLHTVICWLTGYSENELQSHLHAKSTFEEFFEKANVNVRAELITGSICGVKIQEIKDPLMKKIRYLDKLVDEVANGRAIEKILR